MIEWRSVRDGFRFVRNMPAEEYHALPGINVSSLKVALRSAQAYRYAKDNPRPPSSAMALGTLAHLATLEPVAFDALMVEPALDKRTKAFKEWQAVQPADAVYVPADAHAAALAMAYAVRSHAPAVRYLADGTPEVSMFWRTEGFACRGRADWLGADGPAVVCVDLKTCRDASPRGFGRAAASLGYHVQAAWYHDGIEAITGAQPRMVLIAVESAPPHEVAVYVVDDATLAQGRAEYQRALDLVAACEASGEWPGAVEGEAFLQLPRWAFDEEDDGDAGLTGFSEAP